MGDRAAATEMVGGEIKDSVRADPCASAARRVEVQGLSAQAWLAARRQRPQNGANLGTRRSNWSPQQCLAASSRAKIDCSRNKSRKAEAVKLRARRTHHGQRNHQLLGVAFGNIDTRSHGPQGLNFSGSSSQTLSECPDPDIALRPSPSASAPNPSRRYL